MAGREDEAQEIVVERIVDPGLKIWTLDLRRGSRSPSRAPRVFRSCTSARRSRSTARCLAVAMSQAPGLSGTPDSGHCSRAATSASCGKVLGDADVAHHPGQAGDQPRGLDPPNGLDGAVDVARRHADRRRRAGYWLASTCARSRASCSRSSGVNSSPKSSASKTGRISTTPSLPGRVRHAPDPLDRLVERLHLPHPVAREELLGLGERAVDHLALAARERHPHALRARVQAIPSQHHAGLDELLVEVAHLREQLLARHHAGLALLRRLDQDHDSHPVVPPSIGLCFYQCVERAKQKSTRHPCSVPTAPAVSSASIAVLRKEAPAQRARRRSLGTTTSTLIAVSKLLLAPKDPEGPRP